MNSPELRIISEAVKIILKNPNIDNQFDIQLIKFHARSIEEILAKANEQLHFIESFEGENQHGSIS